MAVDMADSTQTASKRASPMRACVAGSVWSVPLYELNDDADALPPPTMWGTCIVSYVGVKSPKRSLRAVVHGFGPVFGAPPSRLEEHGCSTPRLSCVVEVSSIARFGYNCIGVRRRDPLVQRSAPLCVCFDEDLNGWAQQLIKRSTLEDLGPGRLMSSDEARGAVLGGICDPLWFSYNLLQGIRMKWKGKPPLAWYRRLVREGRR